MHLSQHKKQAYVYKKISPIGIHAITVKNETRMPITTIFKTMEVLVNIIKQKK